MEYVETYKGVKIYYEPAGLYQLYFCQIYDELNRKWVRFESHDIDKVRKHIETQIN